MDTVVLGAGISGLAAGYELASQDHDSYCIVEADAEVGGLCKTAGHGDYLYDTVSHLLHFQHPEVRRFVEGLIQEELLSMMRRAFIYSSGKMVPYPYQMHLGFLPFADMVAALAGLVSAKLLHPGRTAPRDFGEWIDREFGEGIASQFMRPYNRKLWGVPVEQLSTDWMRFVPKTNLRAVFSSLFAGKSSAGYNASFLYPRKGGIKKLMEALARRCAYIKTSTRVEHIDLAAREVRLSGGEHIDYNNLISTIDLPQFAKIASGLSEAAKVHIAGLRSTSLLSVIFCIRRPLPHDAHWIYFAEPQYPFFRLFFPSNVNPEQAPAGCSIISAEISQPEADHEKVQAQVVERLISLGYLHSHDEIEYVDRFYFARAYPLHDLERRERLAPVLDELRQAGVHSIGRFGAWNYNSIEDCILEARAAVRNLSHSPMQHEAKIL